MGTIKVAATRKSESGKLFERVKQSQSEIPKGIAARPSVEDVDNGIAVLPPKRGPDCPFINCTPKASKRIMPRLEKVLIETIGSLPLEPNSTCPWAGAVRNSRFE